MSEISEVPTNVPDEEDIQEVLSRALKQAAQIKTEAKESEGKKVARFEETSAALDEEAVSIVVNSITQNPSK